MNTVSSKRQGGNLLRGHGGKEFNAVLFIWLINTLASEDTSAKQEQQQKKLQQNQTMSMQKM